MNNTLILIFFSLSTVYFGRKAYRITPTFFRFTTSLITGVIKWPGPRIHDPDHGASIVRERLGMFYENLFPTFIFHVAGGFGAFVFSLLMLLGNTSLMSDYVRINWTWTTVALVLFALAGGTMGFKKANRNVIQLNMLFSDLAKKVEPRVVDSRSARSKYAIEHPLIKYRNMPAERKRALNQFYESIRCKQDGDERRAIALYQEAMRRDPSLHKNACETLSAMTRSSGLRKEGAIYYWLGNHSEHLSDLKQAVVAYEKAVHAFIQIGYNHRASRACNNLGSVKMQMKDPSAMVEFEKSIALDPANGMAHISIGVTYYRVSERGDPRFDIALDAFANAIFADPVAYTPVVTLRLRSISYTWKEDLQDILQRADSKLPTTDVPAAENRDKFKTYRDKKHGFEIDIPEDWSIQEGAVPVLASVLFKWRHGWGPKADVVFTHGSDEALNIMIETMSPEPTPNDTERFFRVYAQSMNYTNCEYGRIMVGGKVHTWSRYLFDNTLWSKKYMIVLDGKGYAITASCNDKKTFSQREKVWDTIALSLRSSVGHKPQNNGGDMSQQDKNHRPILPEADASHPALQTLPLDAAAWRKEAQRFAARGQWEDAISRLDQAIDIDSQCASDWYSKALFLGALGRLKESVSCYAQALTIDPQMASAWFGKALAEEHIGRKQDAAASYMRFIAVSPTEDVEQIAVAQKRLKELGVHTESKAATVKPHDSVESDSTHDLSSRNAADWINEGQKLSGLKRHEEALVAYDRALTLDPQNASAWKQRGVVLIAMRRSTEAIASFNRALEIQPQDKVTWYLKAIEFTVTDQTKEALDCWNQVLEIDPQATDAWFNKGHCLTALGRMEEALACWDQMLVIKPQDTVAWSNKGNCLAELGRMEEALACFEQVLDLGADDVITWSRKGLCLAHLGRYDEAVACYDKVLAHNPQNVDILHLRGIALAALHRREETLDSYDKILNHNPQDASVLTNKGIDLVGLGRYDESLVCLEQALALDPHIVEAWNAKGACLVHQGRLDAALDSYNQALSIAPDMAVAWKNKGLCLTHMGRIEEAVESYAQASARTPQDNSAWERQGYLLIQLRRWDEAIICLDKVLDLDPQNVAVLSNKGACLVALNHWEQALPCFDRVLELDPENAAAWSNKGPCLVELGHLEDALACFNRALELDPDSVATWANKGRLLAKKLGRPDDAITCFDRALELDPQDDVSRKEKAEVLFSLGRDDDALACIKKNLPLPDLAQIKQEVQRKSEIDSQSKAKSSIPSMHISPGATARQPQQGIDRNAIELMAYYDRPLLIISLGRDIDAVMSEVSVYSQVVLDSHEEALTGFDRLLSANPRNADLWCNKALILTTLGRHEESIVCCDRALDIEPRFSAALNNKGVSLANLGRWEEALACFTQILTRDNRNSGVWNNKGIVLSILGDTKKAMACYERALRLNPKNVKAWFNQAIIEDVEGRPQNAAHIYKYFLELVAEDNMEPTRDTIWVKYAQKRLDDLETR